MPVYQVQLTTYDHYTTSNIAFMLLFNTGRRDFLIIQPIMNVFGLSASYYAFEEEESSTGYQLIACLVVFACFFVNCIVKFIIYKYMCFMVEYDEKQDTSEVEKE